MAAKQELYIEQEVRKAIDILYPPGALFEVRTIGGRNGKNTLSGYFSDADTLFEAFKKVDLRKSNVYITLNALDPACGARGQWERFVSNATATADNNVIWYQWFFVDLDPIRIADVSSTDEELGYAKELARKVYVYLKDLGFEEPVKALSGNGCHLLYRISMKNDEEGKNTALVEKCLKVLAMLFDTDKVKIDTTNYNPSRICKLHGTLAQKGANKQDRPYRFSRIFSGHPDMPTTSKVFLEKLAAQLPDDDPPPTYRNNRQSYQQNDFDLIDFMSRNGITYKEDSNDRCRIYRLDACPFDPSHRNGDAKIFHYTNGAIAFKCHHNHCRDYRWQDVRKKFEPDAYEREFPDETKYDRGWQNHNREKSKQEVPGQELLIPDSSEVFRTAREILDDPEPDYEYIRSGITVIDERMKGLQKTGVSVVSGVRGSGKSTMVGQIIVNAIEYGQNVVCYSGELNNKKYLHWLIRMAAGKNHVKSAASGMYVEKADENLIAEWMGEHFWLYNNKFGNKFSKIEQFLRVKLTECQADLCVIDNLMALDLSEYDRDKYEAQTAFMWALKNLAELTNTHIMVVAHPKKANGFIRLNDISGSGNISNIVDNAFLVHRVNRDFLNGYQDTFKVSPSNDGAIDNDTTNVIEITKDREFGTQDVFVRLYYEESTKRLRNTKDEFTHYGWEPDADEFTTDLPDDIPF